jgi:hypothetical protein
VVPNRHARRDHLVLEILGRRGGEVRSALPPHANAARSAEGEEDAEGDAEAPDSLHLEAGGAIGAGPDPVVDLLHIGGDGADEGGGGARGGKGGAVEVGEGLADGDGDNDDGDQDGGVKPHGDGEGEEGVEVEDVGEHDVEHGDAGLGSG